MRRNEGREESLHFFPPLPPLPPPHSPPLLPPNCFPSKSSSFSFSYPSSISSLTFYYSFPFFSPPLPPTPCPPPPPPALQKNEAEAAEKIKDSLRLSAVGSCVCLEPELNLLDLLDPLLPTLPPFSIQDFNISAASCNHQCFCNLWNMEKKQTEENNARWRDGFSRLLLIQTLFTL